MTYSLRNLELNSPDVQLLVHSLEEVVQNSDYEKINDQEEKRPQRQGWVLFDCFFDFSSYIIVVLRIFALK